MKQGFRYTIAVYSLRNIMISTAFLISLHGCNKVDIQRPYYFDKTFKGLWAKNEWIYRFRHNGSFELESKGHYDFATYSGTYFILDSTIYLTRDSDWQVLAGVLKPRLIVKTEECIRDDGNNFYCTSINALNERIEQEYLWQEKVISVLDSLPIVIETVKRITEPDEEFYQKARFTYQRIIVVNKKELHHFILERNNKGKAQGYLDILVNKQPFEIYLHHNIRHSLSLIYKK